MMDVGSQLRRAREARGLSINHLSATTRIQPRVLEGIERNDLSVVPPRPYARGFVAAVAREVGLPPDEIVHNYFAQFAPDPGMPQEAAPAAPDPAASFDARRITALVAVAVLAVASVVMMSRSDAIVPAERGVVGTTGSITPGSTDVRPVAARPVAPAAAPDVTPAPTRAPDEIVAVIDVERPAWIAASADGQRVLYRIVQPGATETLRARREVTIRVGDAGAVRLSVNGGPAAPMGQNGQVRNVTLTQAALR